MRLFHEQSLLAVLPGAFIHVAAIGGHEAIYVGAPSIIRILPGTLALVALVGLALLTPSRWCASVSVSGPSGASSCCPVEPSFELPGVR